ncbi:MAG: (2Fe-2S)-binding protein [Acidobacteriota bacterium]
MRNSESVRRGAPLSFTFDREEIRAFEGETIAAALVAEGRTLFRRTARRGAPRGVFCGMGVCYDCLVQVDGRPNRQACLVPVRAGMRVETQIGDGTWGSDGDP